MVIRTNVPGIHVMHENIKIRGSVSKTIEKLSSGFRINRAADDVAGLGVSESMRAQITELARAQRNVQEGIDVTNTADGALAEINSMLIRARELCIEGANGIYTQPELDAISDELNEIFDDIDRITEATRHNDIQLFRYEGANLVKEEVKYDYVDHFNKVPDTSTVDWGTLDFIQEKDFCDPEPGIGATVTMTFDDSVDMNDVKTLNGKTVNIYGSSYTFLSTSYPSSYQQIGFSESDTIEDVMNRLVSRESYLTSATVDRNNRTVTFQTYVRDKTTYSANGNPGVFVGKDADGAWANNRVYISSFERVDPSLGSAKITQKITYSDSVSNTPTRLWNPDAQIGASNSENLNRNKLIIKIGNYPVTVPLSKFGFTANSTWRDVAQALANELNGKTVPSAKGTIHASYNDATGLSISADGLDITKSTSIEISEQTEGSSGGSPTIPGALIDKKTLQFDPLNLSVKEVSPFNPSFESFQAFEIKIPDSIPNKPFCVKLNSSSYYFYDSSRDGGVFPPAGYGYSGSYPIDVKGMSAEDIKKSIYQKAISAFSYSYDIDETTPGSAFNITNKSSEQTVSGVSAKVTASSKTFTATKYESDKPNPSYKPASSQVLGYPYVPGVPTYLSQQSQSTATLDLGASNGDGLKSLVGKGGSIAGYSFEFSDGTGLRTDYDDVDISTLSSPEQVRDYFKEKSPFKGNSAYTVELDETDTNHVKLVISKNNGTMAISNGYSGRPNDGLFTNKDGESNLKYFTGGSDGGYSYAEIDFSSINNDNLDTLLGQGFRITCATCGGEYINVFFCWKKDDSMPESFDVMDDSQNPPAKRTIHNIAVELSKISDGEKIVENIVSQVSGQLKHFTQVEVGNPPTTLIAKDARLGGTAPRYGSVLSGVKTNFEYSYEKVEVKDDPPASVGDGENPTIDYRNMLIYVGSEPDHQWIPIHLPWLDLPTLHLSPPETVDLGGGDDPFDWLKRVDSANGVITAARSRIGADYNRLEHTYSALTQTRENMEDSESRIRDADMAKLMVQYMKDQIIGQAQQSMMLHSNERPQQVLELLR